MIKQNQNIELFKRMFPIPNFDQHNLAHWDQLHQYSIQSIVNSSGALSEIPPFEKHPYLEPLDINTTATGLMIGTFPPISYLCSQLNLANLTYNTQSFNAPMVDYFHGNLGSLWQYSPIGFDQIILSNPNERPQLIVDALNAACVIYTDIIKYTQRILNNNKYDARDKNLRNIIPNFDIFKLLFHSDSINRIYFTNTSFFVSSSPLFAEDCTLNIRENDAFGLFIKSALDYGIKVEYQIWNSNEWIEINENPRTVQQRRLINNQLKTKIVLKLKLKYNENEKTYEICSCASPAAVNRNAHLNPCCIQFGGENNFQGVQRAKELLRYVLNCFFSNNLNLLAQYNR